MYNVYTEYIFPPNQNMLQILQYILKILKITRKYIFQYPIALLIVILCTKYQKKKKKNNGENML